MSGESDQTSGHSTEAGDADHFVGWRNPMRGSGPYEPKYN
jgi:hypothetical protein